MLFHHPYGSLAAIALTTSTFTLALLQPGVAQITPDQTLGREGSQVTRDVMIRGALGDRIDAGATRGSSLFHSFSEFNVNQGQRVYFANPAGIENILSRVTGDDISDIMGTLGVDGGANLFFLNPNGIIFGPNAQLDIRGSFTASTADSFFWVNGSSFSATDPQAPPLLTMSVPIGLQYGTPQGDLTNQANLAVDAGRSLTLQGATLTHEGSLTAPGGRVQLLGDRVLLLNQARVDVSGATGGGTALIGGDFQGQGAVPTSDRTYIAPSASIQADALHTGDGGQVVVWADDATAFYGQIAARGGAQSGNGGQVEVSGRDYLIFRGGVDASAPQGTVGSLLLDPVNITIANGIGDGAADGTAGFAGDVFGFLGVVLAGDNAPATIFESELEGLAGNVNVLLEATNDITVQNLADDTLQMAAGNGFIGFLADADESGAGAFTMADTNDTIRTNGRDIFISAATMTVGNIDTSPASIFTLDVDAGGAIPPLGTSGLSTFTFTIPAALDGATVADANVRFSAAHTWDSDLVVSLQSAAGTTLELLSQAGGSGDNFQDTLLDDEAAIAITNGVAPFIGTYQPTGAGGLAVFDGEVLDGGVAQTPWALTVNDVALGDAGQLYQAGDLAAWGAPAEGTQLIITTTAIGNGGDITLQTTTGDLVVAGDLDSSSVDGIGGDITLHTGVDVNGDAVPGSTGSLRITGGRVIANSANSAAAGFSRIWLESEGGSILLDQAEVSAVNNGTGFAGDIFINADDEIAITNNSLVSANGNFGRIFVGTSADNLNALPTAQSVRIDNSTLTSTNGIIDGIDDAGDIAVQAVDQITLTTSRILTDTVGGGSGGDISLDSEGAIALDQGSLLSANTSGTGDGGGIFFTAADAITLQGRSTLNATTSGLGSAGLISLEGGDRITFDNSVANVETTGPGQGGQIALEAGAIALRNNAVLNATVRGSGDGAIDDGRGGIDPAIALTTLDDATARNPFPLQVDNSRISTAVEAQGTGTGGDIAIDTAGLHVVNGGRIQALTRGAGDAGDIQLTVSDRLEIAGVSPTSGLFSGVLTSSEGATSGTGGNLRINAPGQNRGNLVLRDRGFLNAGTRSTQDGGSIAIYMDSVTLDTGGQILTSAFGAGDAGNILIDAPTGISLSGSSDLPGSPFAVPDLRIFSLDDRTYQTLADANVARSNRDLPYVSLVRTPTQIQALDATGTTVLGNAAAEEEYYAFTVTQTGDAIFDIDATSGIDTEIFLFDAAGNLLAQNDDADAVTDGAGGSANTLDSFIAVSLQPGTYLLGVSEYNSFASDGVSIGGNPPDLGDTYTLQLSAQNPGRTLSNFSVGDINPNESSHSSVLAQTSGSGRAGNLTLNTRQLQVRNEAEISASTTGLAPGGNVTIDAQGGTVSLSHGGRISTAVRQGEGETTPQGSGGDIWIRRAGRVELRDRASLDAGTNGQGDGGTITINTVPGGSVSLRDSNITAAVAQQASGDGGDIAIHSGSLHLSQGARLEALTLGAGDAGNVGIDFTDQFTISGANQLGLFSGVLTSSEATSRGTGGDIRVNVDAQGHPQPQGEMTLSQGGFLSARTSSARPGGSIDVNVARLTLTSGGQLIASTTAAGTAGNINVNATEAIVVQGTNPNPQFLNDDTQPLGGTVGELPEVEANDSITTAQFLRPRLFSLGFNPDIGASSFLPHLSIFGTGNGTVTADNTDNGNGFDYYAFDVATVGSLATFDIDDSNSTGTAPSLDTQLFLFDANGRLLAQNDDSFLTDGADGSTSTLDSYLSYRFGQGDLATSNRFVLGVGRYDSSVSTTNPRTPITGNSPQLGQTYTLNVSINDPTYRFNRNNPNQGSQSGLFAQSEGGLSQAGNLTLHTNQLSLTHQGLATVSSEGAVGAGNLTVNARNITLRDRAALTAETEAGSGGNIRLLHLDRLQVDNSQISASTETGRAGNVSVVAVRSVTLSGTLENGDRAGIRVEATRGGNAGNLTIRTDQLTLDDGAEATVSSTQRGIAGNLTVNADHVQVLDQARIAAETVAGRGGNIRLQNLAQLTVQDGEISASTRRGAAGNVTVDAARSVTLTGNLQDGDREGIRVEATQGGNAGNLTIRTDQLTLDNGAEATVSSRNGTGIAGSLTVRADQVALSDQARIAAETDGGRGGNIHLRNLDTLTVDQSEISASTQSGRAGNVTVDAAQSVQLTGTVANGEPGGIRVEATQGGNAGRLTLTTSRFSLADGAEATVSSTRNGIAGDLAITADTVTLEHQARIAAETEAGRGGNLDLQVGDTLDLSDGSVISASTQRGSGGNVTIQAERAVTVEEDSRLAAEATDGGTAGSLSITTEDLTVRDSTVTVSSPEGQAGNLAVDAAEVRLSAGRLEAIAGQGANGNITLNMSGPLMLMLDHSLVSAEARGSADGGNVTLNLPGGFLIANPYSDSDIVASAEGQGDGGNIQIQTYVIFGLELRDPRTPLSDINASSRFGTSGTIILSTLGIDPTRGLAELPTGVVDATQLVAQSCGSTRTAENNLGTFIITGRGGLPSSPIDTLGDDMILTQLASLEPDGGDESTPTALAPAPDAAAPTLMEAQGWVVGADGTVQLIANSPTVNPHASTLSSVQCR